MCDSQSTTLVLYIHLLHAIMRLCTTTFASASLQALLWEAASKVLGDRALVAPSPIVHPFAAAAGVAHTIPAVRTVASLRDVVPESPNEAAVESAAGGIVAFVRVWLHGASRREQRATHVVVARAWHVRLASRQLSTLVRRAGAPATMVMRLGQARRAARRIEKASLTSQCPDSGHLGGSDRRKPRCRLHKPACSASRPRRRRCPALHHPPSATRHQCCPQRSIRRPSCDALALSSTPGRNKPSRSRSGRCGQHCS